MTTGNERDQAPTRSELDPVAAALAAAFSLEQLAEFRTGAGTLAALAAADPHAPDGRSVWALLAAAVDQVAPDLTPAPAVRVTVTLVNDLGVDGTQPYVLYAASSREGMPVQVLLEGSGRRVTVVPPGEAWRPIVGAESGLAQRLWVTPVGIAVRLPA